MSHAQLSPSSAVRWMTCPGSVKACEGLPDDSSKFADEGTDAHELAARCLLDGSHPMDHVGGALEKGTVVDVEMARFVADYVEYVRGVVASTGGQLLVEQRLPIESITDEQDAHGTADAVILAGSELGICDLKYGRGVAVDAKDNPQLMIYALAAYREFSLAQDFAQVRMVIHQPRLGSVSEAVMSIAELEAFAETVAAAAAATREADPELRPSEKACRFCRAKSTCPALRDEVIETFDAVQEPSAQGDYVLADCMSKVDLIEGWCKAVRGEVETRLLAGGNVPGFKLVEGRRGPRKWANEAEAEAMLKSLRLKHSDMYESTLISPPAAEKLAKADLIGPRQWAKVQELITQSEGKPSVAPVADKRPALVMSAIADEFDVVNP